MMLAIRWVPPVILAGVVMGCGSRTPGEEAQAAAVVSGRVLAGPVMPVSRPGQPNTRPVEGARVEAARGSHVMAVSHTDSGGYYKLTLRPGSYVISVTNPGFRLYPPKTRTVVAAAGQEEILNFILDTGIR
jgi:Carboxypeptidase regulatory-like domain